MTTKVRPLTPSTFFKRYSIELRSAMTALCPRDIASRIMDSGIRRCFMRSPACFVMLFDISCKSHCRLHLNRTTHRTLRNGSFLRTLRTGYIRHWTPNPSTEEAPCRNSRILQAVVIQGDNEGNRKPRTSMAPAISCYTPASSLVINITEFFKNSIASADR